jgi:prepilin-type processing-associated H-X9-DG protein
MKEAFPADVPLTRTGVDVNGGKDTGGVFYLNGKMSFRDLKNGTSHTMLVAEIIAVNGTDPSTGYHDQRGFLQYSEGNVYHYEYTPNTLVADTVRTGECVSDPSMAPCTGTFPSANYRSELITSRSYHPGGVQVVFGDGSVHFASNSIALNIWQGAGNPNPPRNGFVANGFGD